MAKNQKSSHQKNKDDMNKGLYKYFRKEKKKEEKERITLIQTISEQVKLPLDVMQGAPIVTMIGKHEVCIENYKGIIEYNTSQIKVMTKMGSMQINGKRLEIVYFTNDEMKVNGMIQNISYMSEK